MPDTTIISLIKRARELLDDESRWIQVGPMFQDEAGRDVTAPESACRWSLLGAIWRAAHEDEALDDDDDILWARWDAMDLIDRYAFYLDIDPFLYQANDRYWANDSETSYADVILVLDTLIEELEAGWRIA